MHVLPRVGELHERFGDALSVIGVHAGKFITERRTERIAAAADRLGVRHAIVNDRHYRIWRAYGVQAWPTIALIDAEGYLVGTQAGEFDTEDVAASIAREIAAAEAKGVLVRGPEAYLQLSAPADGLLRYPSRAVEVAGRLYVTDTGHGRVLEVELETAGARGRVVREWTGFAEPQGLAVSAGGAGGHESAVMMVADRAGHAVWRLGPEPSDRERIAGTGRIADRDVRPSADAAESALRSPWGLLLAGGRLLVSMAGSHQLFSVELGTSWPPAPRPKELRLIAGSGAEDLRDGASRHAALAQPTGLCSGADGTYVADCETSAIRRLDRTEDVDTIVGTGLFDFGDRDGVGDEVLLQHCQDVAWYEGQLAVADTYNDRLKRIDPRTRECAPWPGEAGEAGALREPDGVSATEHGGLLVADTGNHRVVRVREDGSLAPIEIEAG